ncbi:HIRAN domain-containing protein [Moorena sp. SIO3I6]|uniref:HIRAN domain-containing protein n=1 Tax=Moorena sp. SIO3I6 TaxID=2607831 RepID=UPI0013FC7555|nr:HIRAN domain-containing protein [Moorena sp. SIO3I6]NEP24292.1 DNA-binding protein [Moorena sp. SIO3I6]
MSITSLKTLFLAWQDYQSRSWNPVGRLTFDEKIYTFVYIEGAKEAQEKFGFEPLMSFPEWNKTYCSAELFAFFANRVMSPSRPDYRKHLDRLNLSAQSFDLMEFLGRSEGNRQTDNFKVFPYPDLDSDGKYHLCFLVHGLRHLPKCSMDRIDQLQVSDTLWLCHELHNPYDNKALALTTEDHYHLGYCPRYLSHDVFDLLRRDPGLVEVKVAKVNLPPSPLKSRLLCEMTYSGFEGYEPYAHKTYQPLTKEKEKSKNLVCPM